MPRAARSMWMDGLILAAGTSLGCASPIPRMVRTIEAQRYCPAARIVIKARDDLKLHQLACAVQPRLRAQKEEDRDPFWRGRPGVIGAHCGEPPIEIRGDPGRVRFFHELQEEDFALIDTCLTWTMGPCSAQVYEVSACGARMLYGCDDEWCSPITTGSASDLLKGAAP